MAKARAADGRRAISLCFGDFELRLDSGELFHSGASVKLQPRAAKLLEVLATRAGEVVPREEIRRAVWGEETYVDFDLALNFSILKVRRALGESAARPRFVATVPRRGYRFLAPVEVLRYEDRRPVTLATATSRQLRRHWRAIFAGTFTLLLITLGLAARQARWLRRGTRSKVVPLVLAHPPGSSK